MKFGLTTKETAAIYKVLQQFQEVEEVVIFGSRAMGNFKQSSDVDLAVKGNGIDLGLIAKIKARLEETIPVPYFFDVVDINTINNIELIKHIEQHGKTFYQRS